MEKIRRPLQMIVRLELRNDFNDNGDNNDNNDNKDDDKNDNVNIDSLNRVMICNRVMIQMIYWTKLIQEKRENPNELQRLTWILYTD